MITLYGDPAKTRANRCSWMLKELEIEFSLEKLAFHPGQPKPPEFLALNPNGKCPTLVDEGFSLFESLAINLYLAKKYGGLLGPQTDEEEALVTQWSLWVMAEVEKPLLMAAAIRTLFTPAAPSDDELELALWKLARPWSVLNAHLERQPFILGERFSVADINVASVMHMALIAELDMSAWPALKAWLGTCLSRPQAVDLLSVDFKVPRPKTPRDIIAMFL